MQPVADSATVGFTAVLTGCFAVTTPWCKAFLDKVIKKLSSVCGNRKFHYRIRRTPLVDSATSGAVPGAVRPVTWHWTPSSNGAQIRLSSISCCVSFLARGKL
jgi:hypothetical protein